MIFREELLSAPNGKEGVGRNQAIIKRLWRTPQYGIPGSTCNFYCGSCNYKLEPGWRFCPSCGAMHGGDYLPKKLKGKDFVTLVEAIPPKNFFADEDSEHTPEFREFRMSTPEFLIYHDLINLINTDLHQIRNALETIYKTVSFPKSSLQILSLVEAAIRDFKNTWETIDFIFEKNVESDERASFVERKRLEEAMRKMEEDK